MTDEVQVTSQSINKDHKTVVPAFDNHDYVTVAGLDKNSASAGNRARFINQAIRTLRENNKAKRSKDRCVYLMFKGTDKNIGDKAHEKLEEIVKNRHKADYRVLDSAQELVSFVNTREDEKHVIKKMDIFTHGYPGSFDFGYEMEKDDVYRVNSGHVTQWKAKMFDGKAVITSFSCRTGLNPSLKKVKDFEAEKKEPKYDESLAQLIANTTKSTVYAYPTRSDYENTYGEQTIGAKTGRRWDEFWEKRVKKVKAHDVEMEKYRDKYSQYIKQMSDYEFNLKLHKKEDLPPAPTPPKEPKLDMSKEDEAWARERIKEKEIENECDLSIKLDGALLPVVAGTTPKGLPRMLMKFEPKK